MIVTVEIAAMAMDVMAVVAMEEIAAMAMDVMAVVAMEEIAKFFSYFFNKI